jgi:hypothetical protein
MNDGRQLFNYYYQSPSDKELQCILESGKDRKNERTKDRKKNKTVVSKKEREMKRIISKPDARRD